MGDELARKTIEKLSIKERLKTGKISENIFKRYFLFAKENQDSLITTLIQNPYGRNKNTKEIKEAFGSIIANNLEILNKMHDSDLSILVNIENQKDMAILFLSTHSILIKQKDQYPELFTPQKAEYLMRLLEKVYISKLKHELEDQLFELMDGETYSHYESLLKLSRETYNKHEKQIKNELRKLFRKEKIKAKVQSRIKSIYSIHRKITKKNILFSQVLDVVGIRILAENDEDCYRIMESILPKWQILNSRVKDYIALPKENGYKSIHLTMLIFNQPVEIQIRTYDMHHHAQYGKADHVKYKKDQ
ncbi:MAG: hypothetical protein N4A36_02700 [Candidatus Gracilibacteria bacterium]|jgi:(p)ppGpp synthase/HD superfamily hydrolase|nr:hypothetical protein [Candidatus Gracilibacteria bacterium]